MIVSHRHKFIYLRTEKTASTSLSHALERVLGPEDVIYRSFSGEWLKYLPFHPGGLKRTFPRVFGLHFHAKARHVRAVLGRKVFDSYFKFAVERNPWDRQVSLYHHREWKRRNPAPDFDRDMRSPLYRLSDYTRLNNWSIYSIGGTIVADRVLRYERLDEEVPALLDALGIERSVEMPRLRTSYGGGNRRHYSSYYSGRTRDLVGRWYRREIEAFDYHFERKESADRPDRARAGLVPVPN